jgi:phosphoribosyl 1,2-cyclic phosphodiesterase
MQTASKRQCSTRSGVFFQADPRFALGDFAIHPFAVPHDAADPVGFVLRHESSSFAVLTDLGHIPRHVVNSTKGVNAVLLEANHDEEMLQNDSKRPWSVKQRILSRHGHLSNQAAASLIGEIATPDLRHVLLAHLSDDCNTPALASSLDPRKTECHWKRTRTSRLSGIKRSPPTTQHHSLSSARLKRGITRFD